MKFIGQYIQQFIARFRADVYLENISTSSETGVLVVDSDGKITKNTSISGGVAGTVTVADESTDTTCFPAFVTAATGDLALKTGSNLSFNSNTGALTATSFVGPLTGQADTVATIAGLAPNTATTAASQPNITSVGTLTGLTVSGDPSFTSDEFTITSATSNKPKLSIINTNTDQKQSQLSFIKSATGADNDIIGQILFEADNAADQSTPFAQIGSNIHVAADGDEAGALFLGVTTSNDSASNIKNAITLTGSNADNDVDVTIGSDSTSLTTINGDLQVNGNNLTVTSGTSGDATLTISADTDNNNEADNPRLWFKADGDIIEGAIQHNNNTFDIISNVSSNSGIRFLTGTTDNTGTTDPSTGATERLAISSAGVVSTSGKLEVNQAGTGTSNSPSDVAEISGQSAGGVLKALSLVNSVTAALGNGTQLAFHNASGYSPTGTITTTQAGDTTTDSKMEFQIYRGGLQTALTIDHDSNITANQGSLTVGDINLNNKRITITGDTNDIFDITSTTHGATTISTTDTAGAQADLTFAIDGAISSTSTSFSAITDDFTISSSTSAHPTLLITQTGNNSQGGELVLHNRRDSAGVDGDICGLIHFKAPNHDGSDNFIFYSSIVGSIVESNDTDEAGKLELYVTTSDGSSSTPQVGLSLKGSSSDNDVDVTIGHGATSVTTISGRARSTSSGDFSIPFRIFSVTGNTDGSFDGDVVRFGGTTSMTTGAIYHYNSSGNWELADADDNTKSDGLLGVALGAASDTNGVLLRGMVTLDHDPGAVGDVLYLSTTAGDCSSTAPSGNGNIVRIIGYCLDASNGQIWFNPDNTFVEYTT